MDEQSLNELLECSVCLERLDPTSKVLPCQHTFCRRCLDEIVSTKHELRCPECRTLVVVRVEDLPSNILLIRLLEGLKLGGNQGEGSPSKGSSSSTPKRPEHQLSTTKLTTSVASGNAARQQRQPCAKALYNYEAQENGDLSFKKDDIVTLRKQIDENWYHGELNGLHGFFPASYVHVIVPLPQIPQCRALYDFDLKDEKEKDCLSFLKDEHLIVIRRVDDNWLEGKKGDKIGIFPITFVEMNEAAKSLIIAKPNPSMLQTNQPSMSGESPGAMENVGGESQDASSSTASSAASQLLPAAAPLPKRHSLTLASQGSSSPPSQNQRRSLELGGSASLSCANASSTASSSLSDSTSQASSTPPREPPPHIRTAVLDSACAAEANGPRKSPPQMAGTIPPQPGSLTTSIYIALFNYKPQKQDELELKKNYLYTVSEKCQDGWFKGQCLSSGISGVFPGNYVRIERQPSAFKPVNPNMLNTRPGIPVPPLPPSAITTTSVTQITSPKLSTSGPSSSIRDAVVSNTSSLSTTTPSSPQNGPPPPLMPRATKVPQSSSATNTSASQSLTSRTSGGTVSKRSSSVGAHGSIHSGTKLSIHSCTNAGAHAALSSKWAPLDSLQTLPGRSVGTSSGIASGSTAEGTLNHNHSSDGHHRHGHSSRSDREKDRGREKDRERREKKEKERERKSLVKLLYGKSKKPKSPAADAELPQAAIPGDTVIAHARSGSYPSDGSSGASGDSQHRKTSSLDSSIPAHVARPSRPKPLARERYRCIVSYPPQTEHELELVVGDIVYVHKKRDDGWFKGTHERSSRTGLFPGSFVEKSE